MKRSTFYALYGGSLPRPVSEPIRIISVRYFGITTTATDPTFTMRRPTSSFFRRAKVSGARCFSSFSRLRLPPKKKGGASGGKAKVGPEQRVPTKKSCARKKSSSTVCSSSILSPAERHLPFSPMLLTQFATLADSVERYASQSSTLTSVGGTRDAGLLPAHLKPPYFVSPKHDGIRCISWRPREERERREPPQQGDHQATEHETIDGCGVSRGDSSSRPPLKGGLALSPQTDTYSPIDSSSTCHTRFGTRLPSFALIEDELSLLRTLAGDEGLTLDGELYLHDDQAPPLSCLVGEAKSDALAGAKARTKVGTSRARGGQEEENKKGARSDQDASLDRDMNSTATSLTFAHGSGYRRLKEVLGKMQYGLYDDDAVLSLLATTSTQNYNLNHDTNLDATPDAYNNEVGGHSQQKGRARNAVKSHPSTRFFSPSVLGDGRGKGDDREENTNTQSVNHNNNSSNNNNNADNSDGVIYVPTVRGEGDNDFSSSSSSPQQHVDSQPSSSRAANPSFVGGSSSASAFLYPFYPRLCVFDVVSYRPPSSPTCPLMAHVMVSTGITRLDTLRCEPNSTPYIARVRSLVFLFTLLQAYTMLTTSSVPASSSWSWPDESQKANDGGSDGVKREKWGQQKIHRESALAFPALAIASILKDHAFDSSADHQKEGDGGEKVSDGSRAEAQQPAPPPTPRKHQHPLLYRGGHFLKMVPNTVIVSLNDAADALLPRFLASRYEGAVIRTALNVYAAAPVAVDVPAAAANEGGGSSNSSSRGANDLAATPPPPSVLPSNASVRSMTAVKLLPYFDKEFMVLSYTTSEAAEEEEEEGGYSNGQAQLLLATLVCCTEKGTPFSVDARNLSVAERRALYVAIGGGEDEEGRGSSTAIGAYVTLQYGMLRPATKGPYSSSSSPSSSHTTRGDTMKGLTNARSSSYSSSRDMVPVNAVIKGVRGREKSSFI